MKPIQIALVLVSSLGAGLTASTVAAQQPDASANTQCWDVLNNVARDKSQSAGLRQPTGDYGAMQSSSNENKKVQGPGAEPKDPTGVTVGQGNAAAQTSQSGASIRPPGLPNC